MRLVFAGTPDPAVASLARLAGEHEIAGVVTRPDAPIGRKRVLTPSPVARAARDLGLDVIPAARLDDEATARVTALAPELGVIVAYGGLVREPLLSAPTHGWINLHFSLLPAWRGAAPVQHALMAGDRETGVSVFQLVPALDAGDVFASRAHPIAPGATAGELLPELAALGADVLSDVVRGIADGTLAASPQEGAPSLAPKLTLADGALDFAEPAERVYDRFRGVTPEPGAHTVVDGARLKVLAARPRPDLDVDPAGAAEPGRMTLRAGSVIVATATVPFELERVQPAGRAAMDAAAWWRGRRSDEAYAVAGAEAAS